MMMAQLWWAFPLAITLLSILAALFWPMDDSFYSFFQRVGFTGLALFVSLMSWIIGAICK